MFWIRERITMGNIKIIIIDVMQEHVDATEVVDGEINLLPKKTLPHIFLTKNFDEFQKQRTRSTCWIIYLVYFFFADGRDFGK
jgi:CheY-like chemotaxis protein